MLEQIRHRMNVNDRVQVDKLMLVRDFERFYPLQTKFNQKIFKINEKQCCLLTPKRFR